jgi:flagellar protein FliS
MKEDKIAKMYKRKQIESAPPGRLIVMLYDKAIEHLDNAEEVMNLKGADNIEKFHNSLITTQNIITELTVALDMKKGGEIAENLFKLYDFMNYRLVDANIKKDRKAIPEVRKILANLRGAWEEIQDTPLPSDESARTLSKGLNLKG